MLNSFPQSVKLAARFLWREWQAGQWFIVFFAVFIAVSSIAALDFYSNRLQRGIEDNNAEFLGGDLIITSDRPIASQWIDYAKKLRLRTAEVWSYPTVATVDNKMQLVNILAVSDQYPLLGKKQRPIKGSIWVESRLLPLLSFKIKDALTIGSAKFTVSKVLQHDNALLDASWLIAPRVMILLSDVPLTQTVLPGSQINYRLLVAGDDAIIQKFNKWVKPQLKTGQRLLDVHNQEQRLTNIIDQVENFLQLALLICLAMCCIAVVLSIQRYLHKHHKDVALLRSFGTSQQQIIYHYVYKLLIVAITAGALGILTGFFAQSILEKLFQEYMQVALPAPDIKPFLFGFVLSIGLLFIFAYPIISVLPKTSPLFLWRNEVAVTKKNNSYYVLSFIALMLFIYSFTGFSNLTLIFLNFMGVSVAFLYALSLGLLALLRKNLDKTSGVLRRGLSQLVQYPDNTSLQFISFTLMLTLILVLGMVRVNLLNHWQSSFSKNTPNYFAINIAPEDLVGLKKIFLNNNVGLEGIYPLVRGRLTQLNNKPIMQAIPEAARGNNALFRELNLSWMEIFPSDNKIVSGPSWPQQFDNTQPVISVEKKLADDMHFKLGDSLTFQIGEKNISAKIINIREVSWASFHPNFFVIFAPGMLNDFPTTFITSFHLPEGRAHFLNQLVQAFPNITIIDVASLLKQIQDMVNKISYASQYLLLFALVAAVLVLIASLQSSIDERKSSYQLWRILGASKKYIRQSILIEFSSIVFFVIFFSYALAKIFVYLVAVKFLTIN